MGWLESWRAIAARIDGLAGAGDLILASLSVNRSDPNSVVQKFLVPGLKGVRVELQRLDQEYSSALPPPAAEALRSFLATWGVPEAPHAGQEVKGVQAAIPLAVFRSEFDYLIRDTEAKARVLTELAFEHLSRLLAVDSDVRQKWLTAFEKREEHCERLGAVHLLGHGIWTFKVSAVGAATDLVFGESIESEIPQIRRTARALVLTEWKLVKNATEMESRAAEARREAELYSAGVLADLELRRTRYIVLVSKKRLPVPGDVDLRHVIYRHIGLPLEMDVVSREARRRETL